MWRGSRTPSSNHSSTLLSGHPNSGGFRWPEAPFRVVWYRSAAALHCPWSLVEIALATAVNGGHVLPWYAGKPSDHAASGAKSKSMRLLLLNLLHQTRQYENVRSAGARRSNRTACRIRSLAIDRGYRVLISDWTTGVEHQFSKNFEVQCSIGYWVFVSFDIRY